MIHCNVMCADISVGRPQSSTNRVFDLLCGGEGTWVLGYLGTCELVFHGQLMSRYIHWVKSFSRFSSLLIVSCGVGNGRSSRCSA